MSQIIRLVSTTSYASTSYQVGQVVEVTDAVADVLIARGDAVADKRVSVSASYNPSFSWTRPSNTTELTAGDALGARDAITAANAGNAILTFQNAGPSGGHIFITDVNLQINVAAIPSGMTTFRLHLYSAAPTAILDNAAWDLVAGDRDAYLGFVDLTTPLDLVATLYSQNTGINKKVKLAAGSTSLYGILVTTGTYTPTSAAVKVLTIHAIAA